MHVLPLVCHPATPCSYISAVTVRVDSVTPDLAVFYYQVEGDIDRLRLPSQRRSAHTDELWRHTCFEAFVRERGARSYLEFNYSPSSEWAVYRFEDYRQGMHAIEPEPAPKIICRRREDRLEADVDVHLAALLDSRAGDAAQDLLVAVAAVLEADDGKISYWALAHPPGKPDFHHADGFVLTLPRAGEAR